MSKPLACVILLVLAVLSAGLFGMLHNQLSYSVGAAYFHDFKFAQFGIAEDARTRWGAALVGWRASWWMGLAVGLPAFVLGLVWCRRPATYLAAGIGAIGLVVMLALVAAMGGLILGMVTDPQDWALRPATDLDATALRGFVRAALMHNAAYLGGLAGGFAAIWAMWRAGRAERRG